MVNRKRADPQQRLLLECIYEALENAGMGSQAIAGSNMGVFVAGRTSEYCTSTLRDLNQVPMFQGVGNYVCMQSARVSHFFDLRGPCYVVDTACSGRIHALHSAVQSIRSGDADSAVVAGSNLYLGPDDRIAGSMLGYAVVATETARDEG